MFGNWGGGWEWGSEFGDHCKWQLHWQPKAPKFRGILGGRRESLVRKPDSPYNGVQNDYTSNINIYVRRNLVLVNEYKSFVSRAPDPLCSQKVWCKITLVELKGNFRKIKGHLSGT